MSACFHLEEFKLSAVEKRSAYKVAAESFLNSGPCHAISIYGVCAMEDSLMKYSLSVNGLKSGIGYFSNGSNVLADQSPYIFFARANACSCFTSPATTRMELL